MFLVFNSANSTRITELTSLVVEMYQREWCPANETQLAQQVRKKGGVKSVENSDTMLSELAGLDSAISKKVSEELILFEMWHLLPTRRNRSPGIAVMLRYCRVIL